MYNASPSSSYQPDSSTTYSSVSKSESSYSMKVSDGRPAGCCGKGCCWWGRKRLGLE